MALGEIFVLKWSYIHMWANFAMFQWCNKDKGWLIGANIEVGLVEAEAYYLQVCIQVVLVDTVVNDISIVSTVAVEERYNHSMREYRQSIKGALMVNC